MSSLGTGYRAEKGNVQVDVRVEPRQGEDGGDGRGKTALRADVVGFSFTRCQRLRTQRPAGGHESVRHQKRGPHVAENHDGGRSCRNKGAGAEDSCSNKDGVGQRADGHNGDDVLAPDSLAEDKGVLCSDGDDEGESRGHAEPCGVEEIGNVHPSKLRFQKYLEQLKILTSRKISLCHSFPPNSF